MCAVNEENGNKKIKRGLPLRAYLLYLLVAAFLCTGVAFSKYVTSGVSEDRARVAMIGEIGITETGDISDSISDGDAAENHLVITPGVSLTKDVRVHFDGSEMACYVFLQMKPTGWTDSGDHYSFSAGGTSNDRLAWSVDGDWTYLTTESGTYVYYVIVAANDAIPSKPVLADSAVYVSENLIRSEMSTLPSLQIGFEATAVQLDGFGDFSTEEEHALAAWNSVKAQ